MDTGINNSWFGLSFILLFDWLIQLHRIVDVSGIVWWIKFFWKLNNNFSGLFDLNTF